MKNILVVVILIIAFGCGKNDEQIESVIQDGIYQGYFDFQGTSYWCSVQFKNGKYIEWPSGGASNQKGMGCIAVGDFVVSNEIISFELDSFKHSWVPQECTTDILLPGDYEFMPTGRQDSIIFKRGSGEHHIVYYLKNGE